MSNTIERKSRENSRERPRDNSRDRPRDDKEKKKKNKLVFKNNMMNKLEIPTGSFNGAVSHRQIGLGLNNNLVNKNANTESKPNEEDVIKTSLIDESNVQEELNNRN